MPDFKGFIKTARDAPGGIAKGVEAMAGAIGSAFSGVAGEVSGASRWAASGSMGFGERVVQNVRKEAATPGTSGNRFMNTPLLGLSHYIPGGDTDIGRKIAGAFMPSPKHLTSDVTDFAAHPSVHSGLSLAGDTFQIATAPVVAAKGAGGFAKLASRAGGLASESGAVKPGFLRSASEVFAANRAAAAAKLADTAGETTGVAQKAVKAAKQLVNPETKMVMGALERAGSGLVSDAQVVGHGAVAAENATNAGRVAAAGAAEAAKSTASTVTEATQKGRRLGGFVKAAARFGYGSPKAAQAQIGKIGADVMQVVTHPTLAGRVRGLVTLAPKTAMHAGQFAFEARGPLAVGAAAESVYKAHAAPSQKDVQNDAADSEMAKNMNMSTEDFRGIRAVSEKKGEAGIAALVSGLKKARAAGLGDRESSGNFAAKVSAKALLKSKVRREYKMRG